LSLDQAMNLSIVLLLQLLLSSLVATLFRDLHVTTSAPPLLLYHNRSAIFLNSNPVSPMRSKHIDLDYHFLHELMTTGTICTQHVPFSYRLLIFHQECLLITVYFISIQASHMLKSYAQLVRVVKDISESSHDIR
jgi:hypothetical protein